MSYSYFIYKKEELFLFSKKNLSQQPVEKLEIKLKIIINKNTP